MLLWLNRMYEMIRLPPRGKGECWRRWEASNTVLEIDDVRRARSTKWGISNADG